jgi:hypothetical protein
MMVKSYLSLGCVHISHIEILGHVGNKPVPISGVPRLKYRSADWLYSLRYFVVDLSPSMECFDRSLYYVTTISFHVLTNSLFINDLP